MRNRDFIYLGIYLAVIAGVVGGINALLLAVSP